MAFTGQGGESVDVAINGDASTLRQAANAAVSGLSKVKNAAGVAGAALGALGAGAISKGIQSFASFDEAMTESLAIMGDVSDAMRADMSDAARTVATETQFSAEQAAESYFYLASAGIDAADSLEVLPEMAEFAQAGLFDMATATDILTDATSALNRETEFATELGDMLVKANQNANATVEQFGTSLINKLAPALNRFNIGVEQGIGALQVFADQGLKGRRAGTILTRTLEGLEKRSRENADAFENLGVQVTDQAGEMRDLDAITQDLEQSLEGMSTQERAAALSKLGFNKRAIQGIDLLMGNSEALSEYTESMENAGGAAGEVADKQLDTFNQQLGLLKDEVRDIAMTIGEVFLPVLMDIVDQVRPAVDAFREFNDETDGMAATVAAVATTIGGLGTALLVFAGGPATAAIGAVAALGAAFATNFGGIRDVVMDVIDVLTTEFGPLFEDTFELITRIVEDFRDEFERQTGDTADALIALGEVFEQTIGFIVNDVLYPLLRAAEDVWSQHGELITTEVVATLVTLYETFRETYDLIMNNVVRPFIESVMTVWNQHGDELVSTVVDLVTTIFEKNREIYNRLLDNVIDPFLELVRALWEEFGADIIGTVTSLFTTLLQLYERYNALLADVVSGLLEFIGGLWDEHGEAVIQILIDLGNVVQETFDTIVTVAEETIIPIIESIDEAWSEHGDEIMSGVEEIGETIESAFGSVVTFIEEDVIPLFERIESTWETKGEGITETVELSFDDIITAIDERLVTLKDEFIIPFFDDVERLWDEHGSEIETVVRDVLAVYVEEFRVVFASVKEVVMSGLEGVLELWDEHGEQVMDLLGRFFVTLGQLFEEDLAILLDIVEPLVRQLREFWEENGEQIVEIVGLTVDLVIAGFDRLLDGILPVLEFLQTAFEQFVEFTSRIWNRFGDEIVAVIEFAFDLILTAVGVALDTLEVIIRVATAAIRGDWSHRTSATLAAHVLDILAGVREASDRGTHVGIDSTVDRPDPLPPAFPDGPAD